MSTSSLPRWLPAPWCPCRSARPLLADASLHGQPRNSGRVAPPALPRTSHRALGASWLVCQLLLSLNVALSLKCRFAARSCLAKSMQVPRAEEDAGPDQLWRSAAVRHWVRAAHEAGDLSPLNRASPGVPAFFLFFFKLFPPCLVRHASSPRSCRVIPPGRGLGSGFW